MTISVGVGGSFKVVKNIWVGVGGAWKLVTSLKVGSGGAWKEALGVVTLSGHTISGDTDALLRLKSDGTVEEFETNPGSFVQIDAATDWIIPNSFASGVYAVRFTKNSGDDPTTGTLNTWQTLDNDRTIGFSSAVTALSCELTVEISADGGTTVITSGTYTLSVNPP